MANTVDDAMSTMCIVGAGTTHGHTVHVRYHASHCLIPHASYFIPHTMYHVHNVHNTLPPSNRTTEPQWRDNHVAVTTLPSQDVDPMVLGMPQCHVTVTASRLYLSSVVLHLHPSSFVDSESRAEMTDWIASSLPWSLKAGLGAPVSVWTTYI